MALRATSEPAPDRRSAKPGDAILVKAKVENTGSADEPVMLAAEGTPEGVAVAFDPPSVVVPKKSRKSVTFSWNAQLPAGKDALTIRGKLVLRHATTGQLVGQADLDVYVDGRGA